MDGLADDAAGGQGRQSRFPAGGVGVHKGSVFRRSPEHPLRGLGAALRHGGEAVASAAVDPGADARDVRAIVFHNISRQQHNAMPNGLLCLKGGELEREVMPVGRKVEITDLRDYFTEEFFETKKVVYVEI